MFEEEMTTCDICGSDIPEAAAHFYHEEDCPNFRTSAIEVACECDGVACRECCPECNHAEDAHA